MVPRNAVTGVATAFVRPQGSYFSRQRPRRTMVLVGRGGLGLACVNAAVLSDDSIQHLADALDLEWDQDWPLLQASELDARFPGAASFTLRHPWLVGWLVALALIIPFVVMLTLLGQPTPLHRAG